MFISAEEGYSLPGVRLGDIGANGTFHWTASPGIEVADSSQPFTGPWSWASYYCAGDGTPHSIRCLSKCRPGWIDGPQFSALVLVME